MREELVIVVIGFQNIKKMYLGKPIFLSIARGSLLGTFILRKLLKRAIS